MSNAAITDCHTQDQQRQNGAQNLFPCLAVNPESSVWLIIPVHNRREVTRRCLAHLQALRIPRWMQVLVVDDGSTDGTGAMIRDQFPWAMQVQGDGELWWAGAIHGGMQHAIAAGATCLCWLNDDCLPEPGSLELLVNTACERDALCGGLCRGSDGRAVAYSGGLMSRGWPAPFDAPLPSGPEIPAAWLHGNMVAIPASVWRRIGLPECRWMRHNLADIDYTYRAHRYGIPVLVLPKATACAAINTGISYQSWADAAVSPRLLLSGLWNPRVWWYLPGLASFLFHANGWRGVWPIFKMIAKLLATASLKIILPTTWVIELRRRAFHS